jgi:hypothetical protein
MITAVVQMTNHSGNDVGELFTAWDMAHDALTNVATAARKLGHEPFATEAETIANALEARVTALSNMAKNL